MNAFWMLYEAIVCGFLVSGVVLVRSAATHYLRLRPSVLLTGCLWNNAACRFLTTVSACNLQEPQQSAGAAAVLPTIKWTDPPFSCSRKQCRVRCETHPTIIWTDSPFSCSRKQCRVRIKTHTPPCCFRFSVYDQANAPARPYMLRREVPDEFDIAEAAGNATAPDALLPGQPLRWKTGQEDQVRGGMACPVVLPSEPRKLKNRMHGLSC